MIDLGVTTRDKITGFMGVVTGRATYLTGCDQYLVVPRIVKEDGSSPDPRWLDEQRLERVGEDRLVLDNSNGNGADMAAPIK